MIELKEKIALSEQTDLLTKCRAYGYDLSEELKIMGLTYDHLRYRSYRNNQEHTVPFVSLSEVQNKTINIPTVSFFAGAGGMDIGFSYAGFQDVASVELIEQFCETLRLNEPKKVVIGPPFFSGDVKNRDEIANALTQLAEINTPFDGIFHGGPPCQPFSIASNQRFSKTDDNFKRKGFADVEKGSLLLDYVWYINHFRPKVFVIENVSGLLELDNGLELSEALRTLTEAGYSVAKPTILNAADYGVPQKRLRLFVVGVRNGNCFVFPKVNLFKTACFSIFQQSAEGAESHVTRLHTAESVSRYMELNFGERDKLGRVDRLDPYQPSKTVIAGGTKGGGRSHLHPYSPRTLSVRESARLQTFPDDYLFSGSHARQFTQVGNAVPPMLAFKLAEAIREQYFS